MVAGGVSHGIARQGRRIDVELLGHEGERRFPYQLVGAQEAAGVAKRAELQREAEPIVRPATAADHVEVLRA